MRWDFFGENRLGAGPVQNPAFLPCLLTINVQRKTLQIAKICRFQLQERQHTTFQVKNTLILILYVNIHRSIHQYYDNMNLFDIPRHFLSTQIKPNKTCSSNSMTILQIKVTCRELTHNHKLLRFLTYRTADPAVLPDFIFRLSSFPWPIYGLILFLTFEPNLVYENG